MPVDTNLIADGRDMTWLTFRIVDQYGNCLPYTQSVVQFIGDGPAELIGEQPFPLMGGQAALLVRSRFEPGNVIITASGSRLNSVSVSLDILPAKGMLS